MMAQVRKLRVEEVRYFRPMSAMHPELKHLIDKIDWLYRDAIDNAFYALAQEIADEMTGRGNTDQSPTDDDLIRAYREPITVAAVLNDLSRLLGVETSPLIRAALGEGA